MNFHQLDTRVTFPRLSVSASQALGDVGPWALQATASLPPPHPWPRSPPRPLPSAAPVSAAPLRFNAAQMGWWDVCSQVPDVSSSAALSTE